MLLRRPLPHLSIPYFNKAMQKLSHFKIFLFTIISWVIFLTSINFLCSLIVRNRYIAVEPINKATGVECAGYFAPAQDKIILSPGQKPYRVKINKMGFRSVGSYDNWQEEQFNGYYKVLCLGDSIAFGLLVDNKDSYPYRLQQLLMSSGKKAVVFNSGVGNTTIADHLYYLKEKGLTLKPNFVVINFCANDVTDLKNWHKPMYEKMKEENVFSLMKTLKLAAFMRIFREGELAYRYRRSINKIKDRKAREILFSQSKNLEDVFYLIHADNLPIFEDPRCAELIPLWERYFEFLDDAVSLLRKEHIDYIVVIDPHIYTVFDKGKNNFQEVLRQHLDKYNIPYIDLRPVFQKQKNRILDLYNNLPRDFHLSGEGNQILAEELYKVLKTHLK